MEGLKMEKIEKLPRALSELPTEEKKYVYKGLETLAKVRILELQKKINIAKEKNRAFKDKYCMDFNVYSSNFPDDATIEQHEDFIEWEFWSITEKKYRDALTKYNNLAGCLV